MKMLNCPFCNSSVNKVESDYTYDENLSNYIQCKKCMMIIFGTKDEGKKNLIRKWNTRHGR